MKLIKLAYLAHGWHLGFYDTELLEESVYAWKFGPVIKSMYRDFKNYGNSNISSLFSEGENNYPLPDNNITPFLDAIWKLYGAQDGIQLSALTHQKNTPWDIVWNQRHGCDETDALIGNDLIKAHYKEKIAAINATRTTAPQT